ncbi:MAG TPA: NUDIX domain-containing protein [Gemmatimonadales bacterium]|jgi:predicted NUDIX family NTP pyrophosphohydrolase
MPKTAAGLLLFRHAPGGLQVLLVHLGGPFWAGKDLGAWSLPKGEAAAGEELLSAARREFREEIGLDPFGTPFPLGQVKQSGGKVVHAWALEGDFEPGSLKSNTFAVEWPKGSGQVRHYPEVDRAAWFNLPEARRRILASQVPLLDVLAAAPQVRTER